MSRNTWVMFACLHTGEVSNPVSIHFICFCSNYQNWLMFNLCILYDKQPKGKCSSGPARLANKEVWSNKEQTDCLPVYSTCSYSVWANRFAAVFGKRVCRCHMGTVQRCWKADHRKHRSAKSSQKLQYSSEPREEGEPCGFGGCWGLRHPASNPDTLSPPIRTPSKGERGGKNKTRNPVRAYLVTVWQAVITCMANREI